MAIGEILQELRKDEKLTQKEIGKLLNVGTTTVGGYESGNISIPVDSLKTLALHYNVSTDYILELTKDKISWKDLTGKIQNSRGEITLRQLLDDIEELNLIDKNTLFEVLEALKLKSKFQNKNRVAK